MKDVHQMLCIGLYEGLWIQIKRKDVNQQELASINSKTTLESETIPGEPDWGKDDR